MKKSLSTLRILLVVGACAFAGTSLWAQPSVAVPDNTATQVLSKAVMCESVQDGLPINQTIIFEVSKAKAYCWSKFDPVISDGVIFHEWYRKGKLISRKKLAVHIPRWATYSSLTLREADVGPWQLKIVDGNGTVLKTLRFSITQ